ncbi:MAG: DEAD/DEAH box helicase [Candidatus Nanopelagicales bacterium]
MSVQFADVHTPDWIGCLTRQVLEDLFGSTTVQRGAAYQRNHAVRSLSHGLEGDSLMATVQGSRRYSTHVAVETAGGNAALHDDPDFEVVSNCSCPMGDSCKHVVSVILEAQAQARARVQSPVGARAQGGAQTSRTTRTVTPAWEALLAPVMQGSHTANQPAAGTTPLGLLVEMAPRSSGNRPADGGQGPRLRLRPLVPGATGAWIRTGVTWSDVHYPSRWRRINPPHREALAALLSAERVRSPSHYFTPGQWVFADSVGPSLWALLDDAVAAGVALVTGPKGNQHVHLSSEPATMVLDLSRTPSDDILVQPSLRVSGVLGTADTIGDPAHGVFVKGPDGLVLARLAKPLTAPLAGLLRSVDTLTVPAGDASRFLASYYPTLAQSATVESADGSVEIPEVQPPRLALHVAFEDQHSTRLRWTFRYSVGTESFDVPLLGAASAGPELVPVARDAAAEEALLAGLEVLDAAPGLRAPVPGRSRPGVVVEPVLRGWPTVVFVRDVLPALIDRDDVDVTVVGTPLEYVEADGAPVVTVSTYDLEDPEADDGLGLGTGRSAGDGATEDWFDLGILVTVEDEEVPLARLLTALAHGDEQLILPSGSWFSLDRPELHSLRRIIEEARALQDHESDQLRINRYQAGMWEELVALGVVAHQSERWSSSVGALLALDELPHPDPPEALEASLRHYQLDGYQWLSFLWDHQLGGILADDMGLGKTLQTLTMAQRGLEDGTLTPDAPILVVAPTSVVAVWQREAARFTPGLQVATITQTVRKSGLALTDAIAGAHIVVTSYALFRIDAEHFTDRAWGALVLDEAQFVKNHQSRTYQVARTLRAPMKLAITGTPLENSLMDLWALLSIVAPGLFPTPKRFAELYRKPIESGESPELLATLRRRIRPLMLRRTKEAVAGELPPKVEQVVAVPLNAAHRRIYDTHLHRERQRILGLLDDPTRNRIAILAALTKLRQLSLDVHLVTPDAPANVRSSKLDALLEHLVEVVAEGHRCLVFSQFTRFLHIARQRLQEAGIEHVYLDGRTRDRPTRIAEFTDGEAPVFLISLKAGGSGLTLTEADYVFVLDPWWNPAVEAQAVDRTHRIGQDKTVMVYRLVSEGTIEEKVVALQERKRDLFARVVDEGGLMGAPLSTDDIRGLLEA